jgi:transglutaminase-like putative cysteine protease
MTSHSSSPSRRNRLSRTGFVAIQVVVLTAAVIIGSTAYRSFFAAESYLPPIAGAASLGAIAGVVIRRLRKSAVLAIAAVLLAFLCYAVYLLFPETTAHGVPGLSSLAAVGDGLLHGLARILTTTTPADVSGALLALPVGVAFVGALTAVLLIWRAPILTPLLPPLMVFVSAQTLASSGEPFQWSVAVGFLGCALAAVLVRATVHGAQAPVTGDPHQRNRSASASPGVDQITDPADRGSGLPRRMTLGRLAFGLSIVLGVSILAVSVAGALPTASGADRFDPRDVWQQPMTVQDRLNPLVDVRRQVEQARPGVLFSVRTSGADVPIDRVRVATLDTYDGVQWLSSARFVRTGSALPAGPVIADPREVSLDVELSDDMPSSFLPEVGRPIRVSADQVGFDPVSGMLITAAHPLGGYRFQVTSEVPATALAADAVPAAGPEFADLIRLPAASDAGVQQGLAALADRLTAGLTRPTDQLTAIATYLQSLGYAADAAPGHSYAALGRLLPSAGGSGNVAVNEEQTVSAFVIMARSMGYAARVAVGYRLSGELAQDGSRSVSMQDADAWAEVAFTGNGWLAFDTTVRGNSPAPKPPPQSDPTDGTDQTPIAQNAEVQADPTAGGGDESGSNFPVAALGAVAALAVLLFGLTGGIIGAKALRRRRRSARGSTTERVLGAWSESANRLQESGMAIPSALTVTEIGHHVVERLGDGAGAAVMTLAPLVDSALYSAAGPDENDVAAAWDLEGELRAVLNAGRAAPRRMLAFADPRPLLRDPDRRRSIRRTGETGFNRWFSWLRRP